jgi:23S rRNA (cytidine1920-2'-O)/16S rRNA (cytidine1409-2'-O)-methyltransferase
VLQRGAARVYAVDVGKGQLDWKLRNDPRVVAMEGVNAREGVALPEDVDLIVADVSFISLRLALAPSLERLRDGGDVVALVKPQFEAGRDAVGRGGIVRDPQARADAVIAVARALKDAGTPVIAIVPSRLPGREGNREIFVHARRGAVVLEDDALGDAARRAAE